MTQHFFENELASLHYYKFGEGMQAMLCFHGYGMHGKQFKVLEPTLGGKYTFYGFDLFFHKETKLKDQTLQAVKKGIGKNELAQFIAAFCEYEGIDRFSVIGYSMGTHYATSVVEELGHRIDLYVVAAPMFLKPGALLTYFSKNKTGNKILERISLSKRAFINLLRLCRQVRFLDSKSYHILYNELSTAELRFNFYACFTFLRYLDVDRGTLKRVIAEHNIRSIFIFGGRDKNFPARIGESFIGSLKNSEMVILDTSHDMIKHEFVSLLTARLL